MKIDCVYCTYRKDLPWINYSLRLLRWHLEGSYGIVVRAEADCEDLVKQWKLPGRWTYYQPWPDGYAFSMYQKEISDQHSDADLLMLWDSDHMLLERTDFSCFLENGKPIIRYREWDDDLNDNLLATAKRIWSPPVERLLGRPLDRDYMWAPPFVFHRSTFVACRNRIEEVTGLPFYDAVYSGVPYSHQNFLQHRMVNCDYEVLGCFAANFESDRYVLKHYEPNKPWPVRVYWSHGGLSREIKAELDALLTGAI